MNEEFKRQLFEEVFQLHLQQINKLGAEEKTPQVLRMQAIIEAFWAATKDDDVLYGVLADKKKANLVDAKANAEASIVQHEDLIATIDTEVDSINTK